MTGSQDDQPLIEACRAGDAQAFGELVRRHKDRLYAMLLRMTGCAEDAQDRLQDAFLLAFEKLDRFEGESSFYTWLYRIAVNVALSHRRKRRGPIRLSEVRPDGRPELSRDAEQSDPSLPLQRAERDALIQSALNALAPDHRAVVVLKEFDGLRYEEVAAILGVPVGTVRSRLHRARQELRERLRGVVEEADKSRPEPSTSARTR
ncbi:sigma-70 family RNA polymerase sigma factor [soil metagenome]